MNTPKKPFPTPAIVGFLVLLNAVAMWGQAGWFHDHITNHDGPEDWIPAVGAALVVEMVGVYLAGMAHAALMADQSAGLLRLGSYLVGLLVGTLNFDHWQNPLVTTGITFGALSALSPWLWAIYSRHVNRDRLASLGMVDKRGVKLSTNRKFWHPVKSVRVMSFAAWRGVTNPDQAVAEWELTRTHDQVVAEWGEATIEEWIGAPDAPVSPAIGDAWSHALPIGSSDQAADEPDQANDQVADEPDQANDEPDQVAEDHPTVAELLAKHGAKLREFRAAGKLTRYRVEVETGVARRKAEQVLAALAAETDQVDAKGDRK